MSFRIGVVTHDAAGNALGRALVLAELLDRVGPVHLVGFGSEIWAPVAGLRDVHLIPPPRTTLGLPLAAKKLARALRNDTVLIASKTRVLSYGLTVAVRANRPLVLDIDDLEHAFVRRKLGWIRQLVEPDREPITRLLERLRNPAAAVTVASRALQQRFGGTWLPHVRERKDYRVRAQLEGPEFRTRLGLGEQLVVGFVGTPRPHKGLRTAAAAIAAAVAATGNEMTLLIVGAGEADAELEVLRSLAEGHLRTIASVSLDRLPGVLGACDVVLVPQERTIESQFQSPAKLFDAMAAGRAIITSDVGDAREILDDAGVLVPPGDVLSLITGLRSLTDPDRRARLGAVSGERYLRVFAVDKWRDVMEGVVREAVDTAQRRYLT